MRTSIAIVCALFVVMLCGPQAKADGCGSVTGNLVANCGFESGSFSSWSVSGNDVPGEEGNLYGVEGTDPFPLPDGTAPNSGNFQAFIADQAADPTTISQVLATVPGGQYIVSFYLAQQPVGPGTINNFFDVSLGGITVQDLTAVAVQGYTLYTGKVTVTSSSSTLSLTGGNDIGEFLVDDISVTNTPEPGTFFLMGGALFGMLAIFLRKR